MSSVFDQSQQIIRIKYETFSKLASDINSCNNFQTVGESLASNLKYILDSNFFRIYYQYDGHSIVYVIFRGECRYTEGSFDLIEDYEVESLRHNVPRQFSADSTILKGLGNVQLPPSLLLSILPAIGIRYSLIITNGKKEQTGAVETDFKFLKMISELIGNKLAQLILLNQIERKNQELQQKNKHILNLNQTLEQRVFERTLELKSSNQELQNLFYGATHDLRTPITNILGLTNLGKASTGDPDISFLFEGCRSAATRLDAALRKLNSLSFQDEEETIESTNFQEVANIVYGRLNEELSENDVSISLLGDFESTFLCDKISLINIFDNLFENSITFCRSKPEIIINITLKKNLLTINFIDHGIGIPVGIRDKIFEMFYRGHEFSKGSGLGLYVVKRLVQKLGGRINVECPENFGTIFNISVPVVNSKHLNDSVKQLSKKFE